MNNFINFSIKKWKENPSSLEDLMNFDKKFKESRQLAFKSVWRSPDSKWTDNPWDVDTKKMANDLQVWFNRADDERTDAEWIKHFKLYFLE